MKKNKPGRNILIASAWPYANGSLHIGHLASLLPADVLARYHRLAGDRVVFVSGSDCHGTPVALRAKQEHKTPKEISDKYHEEFKTCFQALNFTYDVYTKTSSKHHVAFVKDFHQKLYQSDLIYEKETPQAYCAHCKTHLSDRFVLGKCPKCGEKARGDQCDVCGEVLEPEQLTEPLCAICQTPISFKNSKHLFIALTRLRAPLQNLADEHPNWRKNAIAFTNRYLREGLCDRALTRDLDWGIDVPKKGYEQKSIYIWAENVLGYLSASRAAVRDEKAFETLWGDNARHYYVHGKDNIPFHTIILPALLIAHPKNWHLPDQIISSEYLTLEGRKISTSQNYAIWVKDLIKTYDSDSIRYYFLANAPEKRDADFSWKEFITSHNSDLLGAYGNFVNRSLTFINKYLNGTVPKGLPNAEITEKTEQLFPSVANKIETGKFREALKEIFDFVRYANKYFDARQPWKTRTTDLPACEDTLYWCVQMLANLSVLLYPFLPSSSQKVCTWLKIPPTWSKQQIPPATPLPEIQILFQRIDKKKIDEELQNLNQILPSNSDNGAVR